MDYLSINDIHSIQLNMLKKIDQFFKEHNIEYVLCAGTLLGAIRHQSFIPWDDDVDIALPRTDYMRLIDLMKNNTIDGIDLLTFLKNDKYRLPYAKMIDNTTVLKEKNTFDQKLGVYIDVFPIDGLPRNFIKRKLLITKCRFNFYMLYLQLQDKPTSKGIRGVINKIFLKPITKRASFKKYANNIDKAAKKTKYEDSQEFSIITHSILAKKTFKKEELFPTVSVPFGDTFLPVPKEWDKHLTKMYGDYMTPPPEDKRKGKHNIIVWKKENG